MTKKEIILNSIFIIGTAMMVSCVHKKGKSMKDSHTHHSIDYIEFSVKDMEKSKAFFSSSFGWSFNDYGPDYAGIKKVSDEGEVGGMRKVSEVATGGTLIVLYSNNLSSSLESVKKAGGEITKDIFEFPGGKRFEFKDPSGNQLAVWSDK